MRVRNEIETTVHEKYAHTKIEHEKFVFSSFEKEH
jgi:hypothetical protein